MRIAFSGSHCTGKTTTLRKLEESGILPEYEFIEEITRGMPKERMNLNGDDEAQVWLFKQHLAIKDKQNCVLDRSIIDPVSYCKYLYHTSDKNSYKTLKIGMDILMKLIPTYDIIFYCPIEIDPVDDGYRETSNKYFREWVDKEIHRQLYFYDKEYRVVPLFGPIEEKVDTAIKTIKTYKEIFYD